MLATGSDALALGRPFLGDAFAADRVAQASERLPPLPAAFFEGAYEVRLHSNDASIDFELCLRRSAELESALKGWEPLPTSDPAWSRALKIIESWATAREGWLSPVPILWVEIDSEPELQPFLVFTIDAAHFHPNDRLSVPRLLEFTRELIPAVGGAKISGTQSTLARLCEHLPPSAQVLHLAVRPQAPTDFLRAVIRMPWRELTRTLTPLGFSGAEEFDALLEELCVDTEVNSFNLDLGDELGGRVGIEFYFQTRHLQDSPWQRVFDTLEKHNICGGEKRAALEAWYSPHELDRSGSPNRVLRDLLLKVVFEQGKPLLAKAYLPFSTPELLAR